MEAARPDTNGDPFVLTMADRAIAKGLAGYDAIADRRLAESRLADAPAVVCA
jgi:hypothetical protein